MAAEAAIAAIPPHAIHLKNLFRARDGIIAAF